MKNHIYKLNLDNCIILENARRVKNKIEKIKDLKDLARKILLKRNPDTLFIDDIINKKELNTLYVDLYRCQNKGFSNLSLKEDLIFDVLCILKVTKEDLIIENPQE